MYELGLGGGGTRGKCGQGFLNYPGLARLAESGAHSQKVRGDSTVERSPNCEAWQLGVINKATSRVNSPLAEWHLLKCTLTQAYEPAVKI